MKEFTSHELKLIFTSVRKYQKSLIGSHEEYNELSEILTKLQPLAYSETYYERV